MAKFDYKMPNLLEISLLIGLVLTIAFGYLLITDVVTLPFQGIQSAATTLTAVFVWLALIWLGVLAIITEYLRRDIKELIELLKK